MGQQPQTRREIREAERGRGWLMPALVGVLAVAVLAAALWLGKGLLTPADHTGSSPSAVAGATSTTAPTTEATPTQEPTTEPTTEPTASRPARPDPRFITAPSRPAAGHRRLQSAARADAYRALSEWDPHLEVVELNLRPTITLAEAKTASPATTAEARSTSLPSAPPTRLGQPGRTGVPSNAAASGAKAAPSPRAPRR